MAVAIAKIKKIYLIIAEAAKVVVSIVQVQQTELPGKFVLLLYMRIGFAVLLSAMCRQVIFMALLEKTRLANIKATVFLLSFGSLFDCIFFAFVIFCLAVKDKYWLCIFVIDVC